MTATVLEASRLHQRLHISNDQLTAFCSRWEISEFSVFGSVLRDDFSATSDIDVMVSFQPHHHHGLLAIAQMAEELTTMFHRPVDLITRPGIEHSQNLERRQTILESARILHAT